MHTPKRYQVGGKGGRRFNTEGEAIDFERKARSKDGIYRGIVDTKQQFFMSADGKTKYLVSRNFPE